MVTRTPDQIYDNDTGQSIAASATYKTAVLTADHIDEIKIYTKVTYHASATLGCRVDIIPIQPDGSTEMSDTYVTAVTPSFAANTSKDKLGSPVNIYGVNKFKLAVVNLDTAQVLTLKKLYIY
jgi:hypothetical protein